MLEIPADIIREIAFYSSLKDVFHLTQTCKEYSTLWNEIHLWNILLRRDYNIEKSDSKKLYKRAKYVHDISDIKVESVDMSLKDYKYRNYVLQELEYIGYIKVGDKFMLKILDGEYRNSSYDFIHEYDKTITEPLMKVLPKIFHDTNDYDYYCAYIKLSKQHYQEISDFYKFDFPKQ